MARSQKGLFHLGSIFMLALLVLAGVGYLYWKGYRLDITTQSGAGPTADNSDNFYSHGRNPEGFYYTVQVSVTPIERNAIDVVQNLQADGYDAYYDTYDTDRGRLYKIRLGQYADRQSAQAVKTQIRQRYEKFRDSFVNMVSNN